MLSPAVWGLLGWGISHAILLGPAELRILEPVYGAMGSKVLLSGSNVEVLRTWGIRITPLNNISCSTFLFSFFQESHKQCSDTKAQNSEQERLLNGLSTYLPAGGLDLILRSNPLVQSHSLVPNPTYRKIGHKTRLWKSGRTQQLTSVFPTHPLPALPLCFICLGLSFCIGLLYSRHLALSHIMLIRYELSLDLI